MHVATRVASESCIALSEGVGTTWLSIGGLQTSLRAGFMSNRGRQNVASYIALDLGLDWRKVSCPQAIPRIAIPTLAHTDFLACSPGLAGR